MSFGGGYQFNEFACLLKFLPVLEWCSLLFLVKFQIVVKLCDQITMCEKDDGMWHCAAYIVDSLFGILGFRNSGQWKCPLEISANQNNSWNSTNPKSPYFGQQITPEKYIIINK